MAPNYPSRGGISYQDPTFRKLLSQPFTPKGGYGNTTLPKYLATKPMPAYKPGRYYPAMPIPGVDPQNYSPKALPGQKQLFPGMFGSPGRVPVIPYSTPRIPYGLLMRFLTVNPYLRAGATLLDIFGGLQPLPVTSLTAGKYDMSGWTLDCSARSGKTWDKVSGIGPFGPGPNPCIAPLLVPVESYGANLGPAGASSWAWIAFGPGTLGGVRMDGEEQWRRSVLGTVPPWKQGAPYWERHPTAYNPFNPDSWLPGQPVTLPGKMPYRVIPQRKYPPDSDGRKAPRKDNGGTPDTGAPAPFTPTRTKPQTGSRPGIKRRSLPSITNGGSPGNPLPPDMPHIAAPPGPRVRERKFTPKNYATWKKLADRLGMALELADLVGAIYDALPWQIRSWKGRDGKWRDKDATVQGKLQRILQNINQLDMAKVVENIISNQLEDKFFGALGNVGKKGTQSLVGSGYWQGLGGLGLGSPTGPVNPLP